jgi:hypothetical protein
VQVVHQHLPHAEPLQPLHVLHDLGGHARDVGIYLQERL